MAFDEVVLNKYIGGLVKSIPLDIFYYALAIFCVGSSIMLISRGKRGVRIRQGMTYLFLIEYYALLICSTVVFRKPQNDIVYHIQPFWHIDMLDDKGGFMLYEMVMNVMVFVPIGIAMAHAGIHKKLWQVMAVGVGLSLVIEVCQLVLKRGCSETDDIIHNTIGCMLGYSIYVGLRKCFS